MQLEINGPKTLTLTSQAVAYILDVLSARPFKEVQGLINEIFRQLKEQEEKKEDGTDT
jgi:hypothetical protein